MSLTNSEILTLKARCGLNVVGIGAEVYGFSTYVALFDRAIQTYLQDPTTTSSTIVVAGAGTVPITLAANPAIAGNTVQPLTFATGVEIVVDVGPNQEITTIQNMTGLVALVQLASAHGALAAYPVQQKGAEYQVRLLMTRYDAIDVQLTAFAPLTAGVQEVVGDVKLYQSEKAGRRGTVLDKHGSLMAQRTQVSRDLCAVLGIPFIADARRTGGQRVEAY